MCDSLNFKDIDDQFIFMFVPEDLFGYFAYLIFLKLMLFSFRVECRIAIISLDLVLTLEYVFNWTSVVSGLIFIILL